jgi:hypothetical protein
VPSAVLIAAVLAAAGPARAYDRAAIPVTRWPDEFMPYQVLPEEWESRTGLGGPLDIRERPRMRPPATGDAPRVVAIVQESLYADLEDDLATWTQDLARDGYEVVIETSSGGTAEELRAHLQALYAEGLEGALLVGDLPVAWFEVANDYGTYGYAVFPCDLRYMDLDGSWIDIDGNDIVDRHIDGDGDVAPEIWVGRMVVTASMGDPVDVLEAYFHRNHAFRLGESLPTGDGLVYVDDDWVPWSGEFAAEVGLGFTDITMEDDLAVTRSADYLPRLTETYDTIAVFVHSSPEAHYFVFGGVYDLLYWDGIPGESDALFYDLFACSNANFTDYVYMAGVYALSTDGGLLALGSTKTGSMLERTEYYRALGQGETFGVAFTRWWTSVVPYTLDDVWWYYGLVQVGDPTLRTGYPALAVEPTEIDAVAGEDEPLAYDLSVTCTGLHPADVRITSDSTWIAVDPASAEIGADPVLLTVTLDAAAAPAGLAEGSVTIDAPGTVNGPLVVPVSLDNGEPPAELCARPTEIAKTAEAGGEPISVAVTVFNCGGGALAFDAATEAAWTSVRPAGGTVTGGSLVLQVTLDPQDLEEGIHSTTLALSATNADSLAIPVTFDVSGGCSGCAAGSRRPHRGGLALLAVVAVLAVRRRRVA